MKRISLTAAIALLGIAAPALAQEGPPPGPPGPTAPLKPRGGTAAHAMVSAANPMAVAAGVKVLQRGGDAADAAVAVQAVLGLVVTAVLKYADNVVRSLATACSIAVLYTVNITFLDWSANLTYMAGCVIVFVSSARPREAAPGCCAALMPPTQAFSTCKSRRCRR